MSVSPLEDNIIYAVGEKSSISAAFVTLAKRLAEQRTEMGRIIIFCGRYDDITAIYYFFKQSLGAGFMEPPGALT